jgi:hypothetical protein
MVVMVSTASTASTASDSPTGRASAWLSPEPVQAVARRSPRISTARRTAADVTGRTPGLDGSLSQLDVIEIDEVLVRHAADLAERQHLRAVDAVHLAATHRVADVDLVVVAGDQRLLAAAPASGFHTADVG